MEEQFEPQMTEPEKKPDTKKISDTNYKEILYDWGKTIVLSILIAMFVRMTIVGAYYVPTGSMKPTIGIGDRLLGCKFLYWFSEPDAGDIVVFEPPEEAHTSVSRFVKRIVAVEGDRVEVRNGVLYVNGEPREEPYIASRPRYRIAPLTVPDGQLFVLGDNRNNSADGHIWGFLPRENVEAKIVFRFWPITHLGIVH